MCFEKFYVGLLELVSLLAQVFGGVKLSSTYIWICLDSVKGRPIVGVVVVVERSWNICRLLFLQLGLIISLEN